MIKLEDLCLPQALPQVFSCETAFLQNVFGQLEKLSENILKRDYLTDLVLSFCFDTRFFNQANSNKKPLRIRVFSRYDQVQFNMKLLKTKYEILAIQNNEQKNSNNNNNDEEDNFNNINGSKNDKNNNNTKVDFKSNAYKDNNSKINKDNSNGNNRMVTILTRLMLI